MPKKTNHAAINSKSNNSNNPNRDAKGKGGMRSKSTIKRLNMYKGGQPIRDKDGKVTGGSLMMSNKAGGIEIGNVARIAPDRRWFGNTRTMSQTELDKFREEMTTKAADPYSIILHRKKIPMALLQDSTKIQSMNLLETETYEDTYGKKSTRKRPKLSETVNDYAALMQNATERSITYDIDPSKDSNIDRINDDGTLARKDDLFSKGQSKRIWGELYKVLDCSDVILQIIDARNVPGTRCEHVEKHIKKNASHKHLVCIINKCDLVPSWVTRKWVKLLSKDFPTLAFHASVTNSFGKGALISLLRQFGKLHADKRQISVGVIGYPNTGKSSIINSLMGKKCCKTAPVPGETKVWQYIALMKRIFLIDSPGIVYDTGDNEVDTVLKGVVRAERIDVPMDFIPEILRRVKKEYIHRQYMVSDWDDHIDFLSKVALRNGKLMKGGEPDVKCVAVSIINDWQRGKLPYFVAPPRSEEDELDDEENDETPLTLKDRVDEESGDDDECELEDENEEDNENDDIQEEEEEDEEEEIVKPVKKSKKNNSSWNDL